MFPVKIKANNFKQPKIKLTTAAESEDLLPYLSKLMKAFI